MCVSTAHTCLVHRPSLTQAVSLVKSAAKAIPPLGYSPLRGYSVLKGYSPSTDPAGTSDTAAAAEGEQVPSVQGAGTNDMFEVVPSTHVFYETTGGGDIGQVKVREYVIVRPLARPGRFSLPFAIPACQSNVVGLWFIHMQCNLSIEDAIRIQLTVLYTVEPLYSGRHSDPADCPVYSATSL